MSGSDPNDGEGGEPSMQSPSLTTFDDSSVLPTERGDLQPRVPPNGVPAHELLSALDDLGVGIDPGDIKMVRKPPLSRASPPPTPDDPRDTEPKARAKFGQGELETMGHFFRAAELQGIPAERASEILASVNPTHTQLSYTAKWQRLKKKHQSTSQSFDSPFPGLVVDGDGQGSAATSSGPRADPHTEDGENLRSTQNSTEDGDRVGDQVTAPDEAEVSTTREENTTTAG